jgi:microcystin-dependent protein
MLASDMLNLVFFPKGAILMYDGTSWQDNVTLKGWYKCEGQTVAGYGVLPDLKNRFVIGYDGGSRTGGNNSLTLSAANLPEHNHSLNNMSVSGLTMEKSGGHEHSGTGTTTDGGGRHAHSVSGSTDEKGKHTHDTHAGSAAMMINSSQSYSGVLSTSHSGASDGNSGDTRGTRGTLSLSASHNETGDHTHTFSGSTSSEGGAHSHDVNVNIPEGGSHTHTISGGTISGSVGNTGSGTAFDNRPSYYALIYVVKVTEAGS